jgi:acyl CoA:acetate/3-ketoacid CoA transferase beta subunit
LTGKGPVAVISDAAILSSARRTTLTDLHPGATPEQVQAPTGWNLKTTDPFTFKWDHHTKRKNRTPISKIPRGSLQ